ncbi:acyl CoA binding protein-domain-containing protein [Pisolithus marmoratus]|nr:acyl CoA binding protein-domain-containing protein [Pisolithus marmoratus]
MDPHRLLDAQFNRAVEIVQGLPKTGPIQTGYEEKLNMYSLYKQATIGNVTSSRPGLLDMLGRAKWDAWSKLKDMNPYEAKWRYVDALLKTLNKHSDKSTTQDLINDLQSYGPDTVLGHSSTRSPSPGSDSSGSTASAEGPRLLPDFVSRLRDIPGGLPQTDDDSDGNSDADEIGNEPRELSSLREPPGRPLSSISSRYRTPLTSTLTTSPPPRRFSVPATQPLPLYETRSAFDGPHSESMTPPHSGRLPPPTSHDLSPQAHPAPSYYKGQPLLPLPSHYSVDSQLRPPSHTKMSLEAAVENVQAHVAALTERLDSIEASITRPMRTSSFMLPSLSSSGSGSPTRQRVEHFEWDVEDMGLWAYVLRPTMRGVQVFQRLLNFLLHSENQSPVLVIVRRLCLDISFILSVLGLLKLAWRKSRARRREISVALGILWAALLGSNRHLIQHTV